MQLNVVSDTVHCQGGEGRGREGRGRQRLGGGGGGLVAGGMKVTVGYRREGGRRRGR